GQESGVSGQESEAEIRNTQYALPDTQQAASNLKSKIQNPKSFDPLDGLQICDALELAALHHPPLNPDRPALIAQVYSRAIASDVKLTLMNQYPPEHRVATVTTDTVAWLALHQLDHIDRFDHLTTLYVPAMPITASFEGLQETIAHLRAPEGCPWDRAQTHESLRSALLEEVYEVLTALDEGDLNALREEMGDLLMNLIMQAQIATEAEEFRMVDVIAEIDAKLKRRHPHVFGDIVVNSVGEVLTNWNAIKQQEHINKGAARKSALDGIPPALPALAQAQKIAHKAERAGFQWSRDARQATQLRLAKVHEEIDEIIAASDNVHRREEIGDLLFTLADLADGFDIDAEAALREANLKFAQRFRAMEALIRERNLDMQTMSLAELEAVWAEVKQSEAG
ncbi:MAG: nucleoside triphosphate pyrophosphohydrolase, partial [Anaerolineae bacterium]